MERGGKSTQAAGGQQRVFQEESVSRVEGRRAGLRLGREMHMVPLT